MKKLMLFILIVTSYSCRVNKPDIAERKYSTGHMGMPGENVFVFKSGKQFYYYDRLTYSEGTYEWVDNKNIKLKTKQIGLGVSDKETRYFRSLNDKTVVFNRSKLFFEGFTLKQVKMDQ